MKIFFGFFKYEHGDYSPSLLIAAKNSRNAKKIMWYASRGISEFDNEPYINVRVRLAPELPAELRYNGDIEGDLADLIEWEKYCKIISILYQEEEE